MALVKITVDGEKISVDLDELLMVKDVSDDMDRVAAHMGYWASVHAAAASEKIRVDAFYRAWRSKVGKELLENDPKLSEWKVRQAIESQPNFDKLKEAIAQAIHNFDLTRGLYESLRTKASMLQSKGAMMRAELDAGGMSTPATVTRKATVRDGDRDDRETLMKQINKRKKK